jgi:hypothetical protein
VAGTPARGRRGEPALARALRDYAEGDPQQILGDYCNWERIPAYREFFYDSPVKQAAAELMASPKVDPTMNMCW